jgi:hypothetical protein
MVHRDKIRDFLAVRWNPDDANTEEMNFFADKILADSQHQYFLVSDHENGEDPEIWYPFDEGRTRKSLGEGTCLGGYYGIDLVQPDPWRPRLYNCYLGGSIGNSAPGFVVCELDHE